MKLIGKVIEYDNRFGSIESEMGVFDFHKKDLDSLSVKVGDIVVFRKEEHAGIYIARNIKLADELNFMANDNLETR